MAVTAKLECTIKGSPNGGDVVLTFNPDYDDFENGSWAQARPGLNLEIIVKEEIAANYELGGKYTLTLEPTIAP